MISKAEVQRLVRDDEEQQYKKVSLIIDSALRIGSTQVILYERISSSVLSRILSDARKAGWQVSYEERAAEYNGHETVLNFK